MTMTLVTKRFRTRRPDLPEVQRRLSVATVATPVAIQAPIQAPMASRPPTSQAAANGSKISADAFLPNDDADGFGDMSFKRPAAGAATAPPPTPEAAGPGIDAIRREGLTGRQLRMARRLAQKHGLPATSDFDAVRLLRQAGIDPFQPNAVLDLVQGGDGQTAPPTGKALATVPGGDGVRLPQTIKPMQVPSTEVRAEEAHVAEVSRIQTDIAKRRRRNSSLLFMRLAIFVLLPTIMAGYYFYRVATPMYATHSAFVIGKASAGGGSGLGGMLAGSPMANNQDAITSQGYLQSMEAMLRLDHDHGFLATYSNSEIDPIQRLDPDAAKTSAYKLYKKMVRVTYDPTESVIKMEVISPDPEKAVVYSKALISYAEEQLARSTQKQREGQMNGARESYEEAEVNLTTAYARVVELQERLNVFSADIEVSLLSSQIGALETQLTQDRLSLSELESNENPNKSRTAPLKRRIQALEDEILTLRSKMTEGSGGEQSIARVQSELLVAQTDIQTRTLLVQAALESMETARGEANQQTKYLNISVNPVAADAAAYPRAFENTAVTLLVLLGIYLMITMTIAILREQMTA
jgi:capsular polysaccharide transport system permease protein